MYKVGGWLAREAINLQPTLSAHKYIMKFIVSLSIVLASLSLASASPVDDVHRATVSQHLSALVEPNY